MSTDTNAINASIQNHKDYLVHDLKRIVGDADDLLKEITNATADQLETARQRFETRVREAKVRVDDARIMLTRKAGDAATATREYVSENPWTLVGVLALAGLLAAVLLKRRH